MKRHIRALPRLVASAALALGTAAIEGWAAEDEEVTSLEAKIIIEFNATDSDLGIQAFLGGPPWEVVEIVSPDGRKVFHVDRGTLKELGMNELSFESEEPSLDDLPLKQFLALFPEGEYRFLGTTVEGDDLVGTATLTHDIPDAPVVVSPEEGTVDSDNIVIKWNPVASPPGIEIAGYEVTVEREDPFRVLSADVPPTTTSFTVPADFLEPGTEYKFEVLAIETSGNQTITVGFFETE
jgi:Fibronectin type III domain